MRFCSWNRAALEGAGCLVTSPAPNAHLLSPSELPPPPPTLPPPPQPNPFPPPPPPHPRILPRPPSKPSRPLSLSCRFTRTSGESRSFSRSSASSAAPGSMARGLFCVFEYSNRKGSEQGPTRSNVISVNPYFCDSRLLTDLCSSNPL